MDQNASPTAGKAGTSEKRNAARAEKQKAARRRNLLTTSESAPGQPRSPGAMIARAPRAALSALLIALAGCVFMTAVAPFAKIVAIQHVTRKSTRLLDADRPRDALALLQRFSPWANDFPVVLPGFTLVSVRCNTRLYRMSAARRGADLIYGFPGSILLPVPQLGKDGISALVLGWPNRLANSLVSFAGLGGRECKPSSGYLAICEELNRMSQYREIAALGRQVLNEKPADPALKPLEDYVKWAESMQEPRRAVTAAAPAAANEATPPKRPALQNRLRAPEPDKPLGNFSPTLKKPDPPAPTETARREPETRGVRVVPLPAPAENTADPGYAAAVARYNEAVDKHTALEKELQTADGKRRTALLDEIRVSKGNVAILKAEMQTAREKRP